MGFNASTACIVYHAYLAATDLGRVARPAIVSHATRSAETAVGNTVGVMPVIVVRPGSDA